MVNDITACAVMDVHEIKNALRSGRTTLPAGFRERHIGQSTDKLRINGLSWEDEGYCKQCWGQHCPDV